MTVMEMYEALGKLIEQGYGADEVYTHGDLGWYRAEVIVSHETVEVVEIEE